MFVGCLEFWRFGLLYVWRLLLLDVFVWVLGFVECVRCWCVFVFLFDLLLCVVGLCLKCCNVCVC